MQAIAGRRFSLPYTVREEAVTARANVAYNAYAHSVAGMAVQFLLFAMANQGIEILMERQRGLWKRLRSAPVSRYAILAGKAASGRDHRTLIASDLVCVCDDRLWRADRGQRDWVSRHLRGVLADGGDARHPRRRARQFSGHGTRPDDVRHPHHGDARRRLGADVPVSSLDADRRRWPCRFAGPSTASMP